LGAKRPFLDIFDVEEITSGNLYDIEHAPYPFADSLGQVFSVLPNQQAFEAQQKTLQNFTKKQQALRHKIRWADFDEKGDFEGAGVVDITGYSFKLISNKYNDDIVPLIAIVDDNDIKAGLMEYCAAENAIIWFTPNLSRTRKGLAKPSYRGLFIPKKLSIH